jgi:putative membrane protein
VRGFIVRTLVGSVGLWIASALVSGMAFRDTATLLIAAVLLGVVNAVIRPIFVLLTLPFTIVTLGLFLFVVNAAMLGLVAYVLPGFELHGFGSALLGSIIVSATGWVASWYIGPRGDFEVIIVERRPRG